MSYLKLYGKGLVYTVFEVTFFFFILNILYYYDIISNNWFKVLELLLLLFSILLNSNILGNKINKKRVLIGIKFSFFFIVPSLLLCIISNNFRIRILLYYLILMSISILGSSIKLKRGN